MKTTFIRVLVSCVAATVFSTALTAQVEIQPNMNGALESLRQAQAYLQKSGDDKGGHRARAVELVQQAMAEVQAGIDYANQHRGEAPTGKWGNWHGRLSGDDQRRFDSYYSRWLDYRRTNNYDEMGSMEERMRDIMERHNIPADVPFEQIASGGSSGNYGNQWRGRLSADDQRRFDSYYSRWLEYRRTNNREEITSMEKRMQDVMQHNGIPLNTPYGQIATPR